MKHFSLYTKIATLITLFNLQTAMAKTQKWPNDAQLVISFSMQFEEGGHPVGAESPFSSRPLPKEKPDFIAESWFAYSPNEGAKRLLSLWDKHNIKVTSHVVGKAAEKYPEVAKEMAKRGHELAAHGLAWSGQWDMSYDTEKKFIKDGIDIVERITGQRALGYNCNWMRRSTNTVKILQELGMTYHIDDISRDEPFVMMVKGKKFAVVPYTIRNNDIVNLEGKGWSPDQFLNQLKLEFDQLLEEGKTQRRMMSISTHIRMSGTPAMVNVLDQFITYAKKHKGVVFMKKSEIADWILKQEDPIIDKTEDQYNK